MILRQSERDSPNPGFRFHNRRLCPKNPLGSWVDRPLTTFQFLAGIPGMCVAAGSPSRAPHMRRFIPFRSRERKEGGRTKLMDRRISSPSVCEEPVCLVCLALPPSLSLSVLCTRDSSREFRVPRERCQHCKDHKLDWKLAVRRRGGPN